MEKNQFSLVQLIQSCPALCNPMDCSMPGFPVYHQVPELVQTHVHQVVMPSNHLILCHPFLLPPSIFPSIRVFSNESVLHIRWPKYWSFSFSISASNEYLGLDWEYWIELPCPPPGNLSDPEIKPTSLMSPALAGQFFTTGATL